MISWPPGPAAGARYEAKSSVATHRQPPSSISTTTTPRRIPWNTVTVRRRRSGAQAGAPQICSSRGSTRCHAPSLPTSSEYQGGNSVSLWSRATSCSGPTATWQVAPGSSGARSRGSPRADTSRSRRWGSTFPHAARYVSAITSPPVPVASDDRLIPGGRSAIRTGGAPSMGIRRFSRGDRPAHRAPEPSAAVLVPPRSRSGLSRLPGRHGSTRHGSPRKSLVGAPGIHPRGRASRLGQRPRGALPPALEMPFRSHRPRLSETPSRAPPIGPRTGRPLPLGPRRRP